MTLQTIKRMLAKLRFYHSVILDRMDHVMWQQLRRPLIKKRQKKILKILMICYRLKKMSKSGRKVICPNKLKHRSSSALDKVNYNCHKIYHNQSRSHQKRQIQIICSEHTTEFPFKILTCRLNHTSEVLDIGKMKWKNILPLWTKTYNSWIKPRDFKFKRIVPYLSMIWTALR